MRIHLFRRQCGAPDCARMVLQTQKVRVYREDGSWFYIDLCWMCLKQWEEWDDEIK